MSTRRWPVVTLALILVNFAIFVCTYRKMEKQDSELWNVRKHILILAARHPSLILTPETGYFVHKFQTQFPDDWIELPSENSSARDEWDSRMQQVDDDPAALQTEMDTLAVECSRLASASITERYAFTPSRSKLVTYLTSNFLHADWWHIAGNMWFLWLAGFVLEDAWGRPLYLLVYLAAGAMSCQFDAWINPGSIVHSIGASGAIAGLMGAFLIRFPKIKIQMMWWFDFGFIRFCRFWMRAYWLLPLWAFMEINYGMGPRDGIGHWAHVGGFLFGGISAVALRYSGLERKVDKAIEEKVAWTPDPEISQASELMEQRKFGEATAILKKYLRASPESFLAWNLLRAIHWQRSDIPAYREATVKLCALHLQAGDCKAALEDYEEFLQLGGDKIPPNIWLDLCRALEQRQDYVRAVCEYEKLALAYPDDLQSLMAQVCAARIYLKRLNCPHDALKLYEAACHSCIPHLHLQLEIESGIQEARNGLLRNNASLSASAGSPSG